MIDQYIADFIRDAQFRMAEIATELDALGDFDSPRYIELDGYRRELYAFMDILYVGNWSIAGGYNHLDWDEYDIKAEAEYLRNRTEMITSPYTTFVGLYPQIVENISGGVNGTGLPAGDPLDIIQYNLNSEPVTVKMPTFAGMQTGDTPTTYFT